MKFVCSLIIEICVDFNLYRHWPVAYQVAQRGEERHPLPNGRWVAREGGDVLLWDVDCCTDSRREYWYKLSELVLGFSFESLAPAVARTWHTPAALTHPALSVNHTDTHNGTYSQTSPPPPQRHFPLLHVSIARSAHIGIRERAGSCRSSSR